MDGCVAIAFASVHPHPSHISSHTTKATNKQGDRDRAVNVDGSPDVDGSVDEDEDVDVDEASLKDDADVAIFS